MPVFPVCVLVAQSCLTLCDPWTVAFQASLPTEFSRQEYWSGLPFSSPGTQGLNLALLHCWQILYSLSGADSVPGELYMNCRCLSEKKFSFFFFHKDHFKSLDWISYSIASILFVVFFFFSWSVMVNFVCYLDWANGWSENWWNSTSCCVFEAVSRGQKHLKWQTE